jgi:hypothetical protein
LHFVQGFGFCLLYLVVADKLDQTLHSCPTKVEDTICRCRLGHA